MFKKVVEDFTCEHCGVSVQGDGFTNHCPKCLWSKHVDVTPGDRAAICGGMMRPAVVEHEGGEWVVTHECGACAHRKRNKVSKGDDFDALLKAIKA